MIRHHSFTTMYPYTKDIYSYTEKVHVGAGFCSKQTGTDLILLIKVLIKDSPD